MSKNLIRMVAVAAFSVIVNGCAIAPKNVWKDPAFTGPPVQKVMVVGASKSDAHRRVFEDTFAAALAKAGKSSVASYTVLADSGQLSKDKLAAAVAQSGADAVMVTHIIDVSQNASVTGGAPMPMVGMGYWGWYNSAWMSTPTDIQTYKVVTLETTLFNAKTDKIIWSGTSEVSDPRDIANATNSVADGLIARMKSDGVL